MTNYWNFFLKHADILGFGLLLTFFSSFGQSFFISLSVPFFMEEFGLSHTGWGSLYSIATLCSAATLPFWGRLLDRVQIGVFVRFLALGLSFACFFLCAAQSVIWLFLAVFFVRLTGQGLMGLTASTTMARVFGLDRGKALSVSALGYPLGEFLLPVCFHVLIGMFGWRWCWVVSGLLGLTVMVPLQARLLKGAVHWGQGERFHGQMPSSSEQKKAHASYVGVWRDPMFYALLPAILTMPFMATGLILNQSWLAEVKSWSPGLFPTSFTVFALARIVSSLISGPMVDRYTAIRLFPFHLIPFAIGMMVLAWIQGPAVAPVFLGMMGLSMGMASNMGSALWAERYGVMALGKIKSMVSSLAVFATALSPVIMGLLIDKGWAFDRIMTLLLVCTVLAAALSGFACFNSLRKVD